MATAPMPDPFDDWEEEFSFGATDLDVIDAEVARFRARLAEAPTGVPLYEEG